MAASVGVVSLEFLDKILECIYGPAAATQIHNDHDLEPDIDSIITGWHICPQSCEILFSKLRYRYELKGTEELWFRISFV